MSAESQHILASFEALPLADQQFVAAEIAERISNATRSEPVGVDGGDDETLSEQEIEARLARLHEWISKQKPRNPNLDDSRESIYEGCAE